MRVLQIHNEYRDRGGEDVVVEREARILRDAGHHVTQLRVRNPEGGFEAARKLAVAPWNPASFARAEEMIEDAKPDVAHVHNTWFDLTPSVVAALHRRQVPTVMSLHNYRLMCLNGLLLRDGAPCRLCVGRGPLPGVRHRCYRGSAVGSVAAAATLSFNRAIETWDGVATFLASSAFLRQTYVLGGMPPERIVTKPNFTTDPGPRRTAPQDSDVVLYVGRLAPEKGVDFMIRLWEQAETGLRLRVIGDGPSRSGLEGPHPKVEFVGRQPAEVVASEMLSARALLFPSTAFEACPLTILEAFAAGLPVLANRRGAMREFVGMVDDEWLREPEDLQDWADGLALIEDDHRTARAGTRARAVYESSFTPEISLERLEAAYETAIG